jgi:hypothetical protein
MSQWHPDIPIEYRNAIVTGDARELAKRLPDESVDLIFTDPPYPREYLPLYGWLAETAARVLRPGGYVFAYCGTETLPDIFDLMRVPNLDYFWTDVLLHNGGYPRIWYKQLLSGYKPVVVFTKGKPSILRWRSTVGVASASKHFHEWGQGIEPAIKTIELLTALGAIVLEPFAGGGTTCAACRISSRNYIAFEIDPATAGRARARVEQTQAMHPVFLEEQAAMEL